MKNGYFTRETYSLVRVSTFIRSPCSTNKGTLTFAPHANVAGLTAPVAVFPFTPGSQYSFHLQ